MLWHICQTVHIEIFTRSSSYTDGVGVANLVRSLSLFSPRHRHFSRGCFSKNNPSKTPLTPRLVPLPGPFMGQLVDHAYVAPRYCTGLEQFLYGTKPIPFRGTGHYECNFWTRCDVKSRLRRGFLAVQGERK